MVEIVTINGCFDILHEGHAYLIKKASEIAKKNRSKLVILINSDKSVKEWKKKIGYKDWSQRPINDVNVRKENLLKLNGVYSVYIFSDLTPIIILDDLKPKIHVKTEEYGGNCIEKRVIEKNGGKIVVIPHLKGYSTTKLIK